MNNYLKSFITTTILSLFLISCSDKAIETESIDTPAKTSSIDVESYTQGKDYIALPKAYDTKNNEQVVVYEFFGYTCPHCFTFEPFVNKWLENKPDHVKFVRIPLNFQPSWAIFQQAYLTAEAMGITEQSHTKFFEALHKEHKRFNSIDEIAAWYAEEIGIDKEVFISTADSFILDSKIMKASSMGAKMQITSTPTLVVNGKYIANKKKHGRDEIMKILDFLVEKEAKSMGLIK